MSVDLQSFKEILIDEVEDIDYQIAHEQKHMENGVKWHYGAKSSKKARMEFVRQIDKVLGSSEESEELKMLRVYRTVVEEIISPQTVEDIEEAVEPPALTAVTIAP